MSTRSLRLREWPMSERPREKLLECGASSLTDAELIALLFGTLVALGPLVQLRRTSPPSAHRFGLASFPG